MASQPDLLDRLERALLHAAAQTPLRRSWVDTERQDILDQAVRCLGIMESRIPSLQVRCVAESTLGRVTIQRLTATSWLGCYGAAHLYLPANGSEALPLVLLCCGHGKGCKQAEGYQRMAWKLAQRGAAVLMPDNIGQGERVAMGHRDVIAPFQCGLSLQGMIVMETIAWLRWGRADERFDATRIAAIGNSGGGLLTLFLGALCRDELAAISSSGYPSTFEFIARKEKDHCHCNLLPGIVGTVEMDQLYGCIAPKPLFLFQGRSDVLFPEDIFHATVRKVAHAYAQRGAVEAFRAEVLAGEHSWDDLRRERLADYLTEILQLQRFDTEEVFFELPGNCYPAWPSDALTTDAVAQQIADCPCQPYDHLYQLYCPELAETKDYALARVTHHQLAAQWMAFLTPTQRPIING